MTKETLLGFGRDPKSNGSHVYCKRCGKKLYAPIPCNEDLCKWGTWTYTTLVVAHLADNGWKTIRDGDFNGYFVCPDCLKECDTDFRTPTQSSVNALPSYKAWIEEMRQKYNYYEK